MIRFIDTTVFLLVVLTVYAITPHQSPTNKQKRKLWVNNNSDNNTIHDQYFPNSQLVLDMATISHAVYRFKWNKFKSCHDINSGTLHNETYPIRLPNHTECLYYAHDESLGTQVLVLRSSVYNYVSVAYAGTDDWKTALADGDILMSEFGPSTLNNSTTNITAEEKQKEDDIRSLFKNVPTDVRVHRGFNNNVFANSSEFVKLLNCIESARLGGDCENISLDNNINNSIDSDQLSTPYELIMTGHSLGAASSVLLGAALHLLYPTETIRTINYGCPKIGNAEWGSYIDSRQPNQQKGSGSLEIFRFVNKIDLVPRLPELPLLVHVGHTLQMSVGGVIRVSVVCFMIIY